MNSIVWITSYPKSGNTWLRIFLSNFLNDAQEPIDINRTLGIPSAASCSIFDRVTGLVSSELYPSEIGRLRPRVYDILADEAQELVFYKLHDAFRHADYPDGIVTPRSTRGVLYLVRNPLDVAVSYAHHERCSIDQMIVRMADASNAISEPPTSSQLPQRLRSWSEHVMSWIEAGDDLPVLVVRYEDMHLDAHDTFSRIVRFVGWSPDSDRVARAIRFSSFRELRRQEEEEGFKEQSMQGTHFFRRGKIGSWRDTLTQDQTERLVQVHRAVMLRLGYLDEDGAPVF